MNINEINDAIINGSITPFEAYRKLREIKDTADALMSSLKAEAVYQLTKDGGKYEDDKYSIAVQRASGTWNFKQIGAWNTTKQMLTQIESDAKDAFKAWEKGKTITDSDGVIIEPAMYKEGDETLIFKAKKP